MFVYIEGEPPSIYTAMTRNFLKICWRNIQRNKLFSLINLLGLTLGLTAFLIIFQYVSFEKGYDDFHKNPHELYRIASIRYSQGEVVSESASAVPPLRAVMENGLSEIETVTRIYYDGNATVAYDLGQEKRVFNEEKAFYADETFFDIFGFNLLLGDARNVLDEPRKVVISSSIAAKYFGQENPIGKILTATTQVSTNYIISGVFENAPANSHFKPDILFSFKTYTEVIHPDWGVEQNWTWNDFTTYVRAPASDAATLTARIDKLAHDTWGKQYAERDMDYNFYAQPIKSIHTTSHIEKEFEVNIRESLLNWLMYIAIIILVIAWVNHFNLSLAKCVERAREVGVRKTFGANRLDVKKQFWVEALFMNLAALLLSLILFFLIQPNSESLLGIYYTASFSPAFLLSLSAIVVGGMISSMYPGIFLSDLRLLELIQGRLKTKPKGKLLVKGLIVFQMVATPLLIAGAYLIQQQTEHLINQDLGIDTEQVLSINGPRSVEESMAAVMFDRFKHQAEQMSNVENLSSLTLLPGQPISWYSNFRLYGDSTNVQFMNVNLAEYDFDKALDMELVAGRTFDRNNNDSLSLVINEAAAKLWGLTPEDILGRTFWWRYSPDIHHFDKRVIGVVKDYQQHLGSKENDPMIFSLTRYTPSAFAGKNYVVKLKGNTHDIQTSLSQLEEAWQGIYAGDPFNYSFLDESFARTFASESKMLRLIKVFGGLSIILVALGLFGLSSLLSTQRTKEVGIRKVLGAGTFNIIRLLSKDFMLIGLLAYLLAIPIMILASNTWLNNYEVRIGLNAAFFVLPLVFTFLIILFSTLSNSVALIHKNPVESLRQE